MTGSGSYATPRSYALMRTAYRRGAVDVPEVPLRVAEVGPGEAVLRRQAQDLAVAVGGLPRAARLVVEVARREGVCRRVGVLLLLHGLGRAEEECHAELLIIIAAIFFVVASLIIIAVISFVG